MKVDSSAFYFPPPPSANGTFRPEMRRLALALVATVGLTGCSAAGDPEGTKRFSDADVPFTFEIPAEFSEADVDGLNSRGDVVAGAGLSKVDVIAVRHADADAQASPHEVMGKRVTSELRAVPGFAGWALECQYTPERAQDVRDACRKAVATVERK
jgi:hypothetical protein